MCKKDIRCERMDSYKGHSIVSKILLLLLLLNNQHLIVSLVTNHSRKLILGDEIHMIVVRPIFVIEGG